MQTFAEPVLVLVRTHRLGMPFHGRDDTASETAFHYGTLSLTYCVVTVLYHRPTQFFGFVVVSVEWSNENTLE